MSTSDDPYLFSFKGPTLPIIMLFHELHMSKKDLVKLGPFEFQHGATSWNEGTCQPQMDQFWAAPT